ncbi:uncharacterized protein VTP21DRAFT_10949 [Calcarisporiella thermophila]|uniref:uncharacterized protein n=1 Tax=Calcarisporiella thermophila TaxID=911321 RepID=UPI003743CB5D
MSNFNLVDFSTAVSSFIPSHLKNSSSTRSIVDVELAESHILPPTTKQPTRELLQKSLWLLGHNLTSFTSDVVSHIVVGPKRRSWPLLLTLFNSFMRNVTAHYHLANLKRMRRAACFPVLMPLWDVIITPASFKVRPIGLPGILAEMDAQEDGREIDAEWVVDGSVWRQESHCFCTAEIVEDGRGNQEKIVLYFHGGAYYLMSAKTHRELVSRVSKATGRRVFSVDYRLSPENPFPSALQDAVRSFFYLIDTKGGPGFKPQNITVMGDSAGGNLALTMMLYLRDQGFPLPEACVLFSPWVDLSMSFPSWDTNSEYDYLPKPKPDDPLNPMILYLHSTRYSPRHPYVSPLFHSNLSGLPPVLIQCGDAEVLRDEIVALARKFHEKSNTFFVFEKYDDMIHVFHGFPFLEATRKALESVGHFTRFSVPAYYFAKGKYLPHSNRPSMGAATGKAVTTDMIPTEKCAPKRPALRSSHSQPNLHRIMGFSGL